MPFRPLPPNRTLVASNESEIPRERSPGASHGGARTTSPATSTPSPGPGPTGVLPPDSTRIRPAGVSTAAFHPSEVVRGASSRTPDSARLDPTGASRASEAIASERQVPIAIPATAVEAAISARASGPRLPASSRRTGRGRMAPTAGGTPPSTSGEVARPTARPIRETVRHSASGGESRTGPAFRAGAPRGATPSSPVRYR